MGRTLSGALAAQKILHPCGEYDIQPVKIPDGAVSTSVVLERRDEYEIRPPTNIGTDNSWTSLVIHQPFLNHRDVVLRWPASVVPSDVDIFSMLYYINVENYTEDASTAPSAAIYPVFKTASTLQGGRTDSTWAGTEYSILTSATFTPALLESDRAHTALYKDIRRTACGYTTDLDASELYNQGRVVSGQWTPSVTKGIFDQTGTVTGTGGATTTVVLNAYDTWDYTLPAVTSSTIVSSDLFRRQAEAKYGSYMPMRICASDIEFTSASALRQIRSVGPGASTVTGTDNTGQRFANDIWYQGWSVGVELWMNLDPHAELRLKVVENLELDPAPSSTFSPFMSPGYSRDEQALSVIREFARISPHAYDADFNRLNKMFSNLIEGLGGVLSNLGIPVLSNVAKPATKAILDRWGYQAPLPTGTPPDNGMTRTAC